MNWREVVSKLLTKADNAATTAEERETLQEKASFLMAKFGITELVDGNITASQITKIKIPLTNPYKSHKRMLINGIARSLGGRSIRSGDFVYVYGLPEDLARVKMLYESLLVQGIYGMAAATAPSYEHLKTFRHAWFIGYVESVVERVYNAANRAAQESGPGTDLVLANRQNLVDQAVRVDFPHLRKANPTYYKSVAARSAGYQTGQSADLGQSRMGGSVRSLSYRKTV